MTTIQLADLSTVGEGLHRPECVLATANGDLFVSDWGGGVCRITSRGEQTRHLAKQPDIDIKPNGIALLENGHFLLANLGDDGGVWTLESDGGLRPYLTDVDGEQLPPTNFVLTDQNSRVWITVSTRKTPRANAYRATCNDGFIVVVDQRGARIVADGLGYTNEVQVHPSGEWLYVNETFGRRTSRMRILNSGELGPRQTVAEYGSGTFPDGLYFDEDGGFWVVSIVSNRIIRVDPSGQQKRILEDNDPAHLSWVEAAFQAGEMGRAHLDTIESRRLKNASSIAFGGPDRRVCHLGCLLGQQIVSFPSPCAGVEPVHWNWRMS